MAIVKSFSQAEQYGVEYSVIDYNGTRTEYSTRMDTSWAPSTTGRKGELFNVGGGAWHNDHSGRYPVNNFGWGSYIFTPKQNFTGLVHMWGAGGGAYHNSGGRVAGGGGYAQAIIKFLENVPYTFVIGEAGHWGGTTTHGGGGRGHSSGGSGGGLSGIFMNSEHYGRAAWNGTAPVSQSNALIIAGGGGGGGHHNMNAHYGNGGGGGGWTGKHAHNSGGGTQTAGGAAGYSGSQAGFALHGGHSGSNTSWLGGGGGGWYGGGGGGHSGAHHDGGSGGSGHIAYGSQIAAQPNNNLSSFIVQGFLEKPSSYFYYNDLKPANFTNPLSMVEGRHAGMPGHGEGESTHGVYIDSYGARNGKIVLTLLPDFFGKFEFPTHTSSDNPVGWTQSY